jgi:hypothetical protein
MQFKSTLVDIRGSFLKLNRPECEANHSVSSSVEAIPKYV